MASRANKILKNHGIKATSTREEVLQVFLNCEKVLNLQEISGSLDAGFDRVTLYRILNSFENNGIIHKVPDNSGQAQFALCHHDCSSDHHNDDHVHFKCTSCNITQCLEDVHVPKIYLKNNFIVSKANFLLEGTCDKCFKNI